MDIWDRAVWAHAEYIKLRRSIDENRVFDMPRQTVQRYLVDKIGSPHVIWRFNHKCLTMSAGKTLRVELLAAATIHWGHGDRQRSGHVETRDTGLGVHFADLPTEKLPAGAEVRFTFHWRESARWEGCDFAVKVAAPAPAAPRGAQHDRGEPEYRHPGTEAPAGIPHQ